MSNEQTATRADFANLADEFRTGFESIATALTKLADSAHPAAQVQQVNLPPPAAVVQPAPNWRILLWCMSGLVLLMVFVTAVAVVAAMFQGQRVTDLRIDMQADRARSETHAAWAREESQIVRGYIWKGQVPRLNPYPNPEPTK